MTYSLVKCCDRLRGVSVSAIALSGNPPQEIAEELKDLFVQINIQKYFERQGIAFDEAKLQTLMTQQPLR